jgi:probable rRNA maturation factor
MIGAVDPLRVVVTDGLGRRLARPALGRWLAAVAPRMARRSEVTVALVGDRRMRTLNRTFRGKDRPTDVLSFSMEPAPAARHAAGGGRRFLGDIVIATGVVRRQAAEAGHAPAVEVKRLALHGLLHLLGYDHTRDNGRMSRLERRLRRRGGVPED